MLCRLALRRNIDPETLEGEYILRVTGQHTLGSPGLIGHDEKSFRSEEELVACLHTLDVSEASVLKAEAAARDPISQLRFVSFAAGEQIPFNRLLDADFDLFDT